MRPLVWWLTLFMRGEGVKKVSRNAGRQAEAGLAVKRYNQGSETRPWGGRVVATEGGPKGRALQEQARTKEPRKTRTKS
jgi:hypothetical protein